MSLYTGDGQVVSEDVEVADTPAGRAAGLMFRRGLSGALVLDAGRETRDGIHMLFVRFPIDVVFLDADKRIVGLAEGLRPWLGTAFPRGRFRYAVELPAGAAGRSKLKVGDRLDW